MEEPGETKVGHIYVIYNEVFSYYGENVFKIGKTRDIGQRVNGYVTSYIKPVEVKFLSGLCENYHLAEKLVFEKIADHRMAENREFFQINIDEAVSFIEEAIAEVNEDAEVAEREYFERIRSRNHTKDRPRKPYTEKQKEAAKKRYESKKEEIKAYLKEYREAHKEQIAAREKLYKDKYKVKFQEYARQRYEENKEHITTYAKQYREANAERIAEQKKEKRQNTPKILCTVCGGSYDMNHRGAHMKSKKHLLALECQVAEDIWSY